MNKSTVTTVLALALIITSLAAGTAFASGKKHGHKHGTAKTAK